MEVACCVKVLGHVNPEMTMHYLDVSLLDLQREFHLARSQPRHLLPASRLPASISSPQANLTSLLGSLQFYSAKLFQAAKL
jgi:hypothetical protein